jgi:guanylate kinase
VKPFLLVLSSPSGGGKTTIARQLLQGRDDLGYSVSGTTRPMRPGERDGVDYHFLSHEEFERRAAAGEFIECAVYGGERYGTLHAEVARLFAEGRIAVLDIDVQGARQVRAAMPDSVHVFVLPPSAAVLVERLGRRATETMRKRRERVSIAASELAAVVEYDYVIINDDLITAVSHVAAIIEAESRRVSRQRRIIGAIEQLRQEVIREAGRIADA